MTNLFTKKITMRLLIILTIFSIWGCNKSDVELNTLPAETQTGANIFGAVIRGKVWTTNGKYCYNQSGNCRENPKANYFIIDTPFNSTLGLSADRIIYKGLSVKSSESFDFRFYRNFTGIGIYHLKRDDSYLNIEYRDNWNDIYYQLLEERETFELNITKFDTTAKIISGKFSGTLFNQFAPTDSIKINEGRFDIKLQ
jgi:hypothetical protein